MSPPGRFAGGLFVMLGVEQLHVEAFVAKLAVAALPVAIEIVTSNDGAPPGSFPQVRDDLVASTDAPRHRVG